VKKEAQLYFLCNPEKPIDYRKMNFDNKITEYVSLSKSNRRRSLAFDLKRGKNLNEYELKQLEKVGILKH